MSELTPQEKLSETFKKETKDLIISTKQDITRIEEFAREIIRNKKVIPVTQRLQHLKKCVASMGKAGLAFNEQQLRQILGEQRAVLNGSNKPWKGGDVLKFNPAPFMWHGVIMKNTTNLIVSLPKVGKSRLFTQMYGQLVQGEDSFLGQKLQDEIPYLYISGCDQPDDDWALCLKLAGLLDPATDKLHKYILQLHTKNKNPLHLDEKGIDQIAENCAEYRGKIFLLLDSYHSHVAPLGLKESDACYAEPLQDLQEAIAPYKPTLAVIHHSNRNSVGQGASMSSRGTTALPAAVSQTINMAKMQSESPLAPIDDRVKLTTEGRASKPVDLIIEQVNDGYEWKLHGNAAKVAKLEAVQEIVEGLNERQTLAIEDMVEHVQATGCGMSAEDLAAALNLDSRNPEARAREVMATLEKKHLILKAGEEKAKGDGGGQAKKLYKPTKSAIELYGKVNV
tara:strand:+ start:1123 stop:2478 length:1356 start_codon:yes stop_codon:yes gene_type:complete